MNLPLINRKTPVFLIKIILTPKYNTRKNMYNLYESILDILLELLENNPFNIDEGINLKLEDLEAEGDLEGPEGPEGPEEPEGEPEGDPEDDSEKKDKKRKRDEESQDDSEEEKQKRSKINKGKGRADPDDVSYDDDYYDYRDAKNSDDEQSFYDNQNSEDDDSAYLAESLDRKDELEKKLENASPEEKKRILNEIEVLTDLINNLLN